MTQTLTRFRLVQYLFSWFRKNPEPNFIELLTDYCELTRKYPIHSNPVQEFLHDHSSHQQFHAYFQRTLRAEDRACYRLNLPRNF